MELLALLVGLFVEQWFALSANNPVRTLIPRMLRRIRQATTRGRSVDAVFGWLIAVAIVLGSAQLLTQLAASVHPFFEFLSHVVVIYLCIGFRQFTATFSAIEKSLERADYGRAEQMLDAWLAASSGARQTGPGVAGATGTETRSPMAICRVSIVHALIALHRDVLAPIVCYLLLPGITGPILYRIAELLARQWSEAVATDAIRPGLSTDSVLLHGRIAARAYWIIDWIPVRMTAASLAVAGDFEDASYCWRGAIAAGASEDQRAMLTAVGSGALGLRLADAALQARWSNVAASAFEWSAPAPDVPGLRSAVGLIWRSTVMLLSLFALLSLASQLGG